MLRANCSGIVSPPPSGMYSLEISADDSGVVPDRMQSAIDPIEHHFDGVLQETRLLQYRSERQCGPAGIADEAGDNGEAVVARALEREVHLAARASPQIFEC